MFKLKSIKKLWYKIPEFLRILILLTVFALLGVMLYNISKVYPVKSLSLAIYIIAAFALLEIK